MPDGLTTLYAEASPSIPLSYQELVSAIDHDPTPNAVWKQVVEVAKREEGTPKASAGFYGSVPLDEMLAIGERLRHTVTLEEKYAILAEKTSIGKLWYDVVLGHVNEKVSSVMAEEIGTHRDRIGLPFGQRRWGKALDIGSGTGDSLRAVQPYTDHAVGLDHLAFLLRQSQKKPELKGASLVTGEALNLPFGSQEFDLVISSGLTAYLKKGNLDRFVDEVSRALGPGGSYFQAYPMPPGKDGILEIEQDYLTSGKGVLACLLDRLVTHEIMERHKDNEESEFAILSEAFEQRGFIRQATMIEEKGVIVLEFRKPYSQELEEAKRVYMSGDSHEASELVYDFLYGDAAMDVGHRAEIHPEKFPPPEHIVRHLHELERLASDHEVLSWNTNGDYAKVFINPLVTVATSDQISPDLQNECVDSLLHNLENLKTRLARSTNKQPPGIIKYLKTLKDKFEGKSWCDDVSSLIQATLSMQEGSHENLHQG